MEKRSREMRLNKFISHHTPYSRRKADQLIFDGRVKVNGAIVQNPAYQVEPGDKVAVNGRPVKRGGEYSCIVYNKPRGELVSHTDPRGRKVIFDSLPKKFRHFRYVGRLDFPSEGLLILTDSPKIAEALSRSDLPRVYKIKIDGPITQEMIEAMEKGIEVGAEGGHRESSIEKLELKPFQSYQILKNGEKFSTLKVAITEGKNRELRRFFEKFGRKVLDLKRLSYGWVSLNALPTGKWRFFTPKEYKLLKEYIHYLNRKARREENQRKG
jgi:23S rRNA pseudouridine2605 synthase